MRKNHRTDQCPACGSLELLVANDRTALCLSCRMALVRQYCREHEGAPPTEIPPRLASRAEWHEQPQGLRDDASRMFRRPVRTAEDRSASDGPMAYIATVRMSGEAQRALWEALGRARRAEPALSLNDFCVRVLMRAAAMAPAPNPEAGA